MLTNINEAGRISISQKKIRFRLLFFFRLRFLLFLIRLVFLITLLFFAAERVERRWGVMLFWVMEDFFKPDFLDGVGLLSRMGIPPGNRLLHISINSRSDFNRLLFCSRCDSHLEEI